MDDGPQPLWDEQTQGLPAPGGVVKPFPGLELLEKWNGLGYKERCSYRYRRPLDGQNMHPDAKLTLLERLMAIYDRFMGQFDPACQKYCSHCCTANVTMTTLEGYRLIAYLEQRGDLHFLESISRKRHPDRFMPRVSINHMADICARGGAPPDEPLDPQAGPCPILEDHACPIYSVRPFACRCMVSAVNCGRTGYADMDPLILAVNEVFLQFLEHVDAHGYSGNFVDVMQFLGSGDGRRQYAAGRGNAPPAGLVANQPASVLMIPPQHRERIQLLLSQIRTLHI